MQSTKTQSGFSLYELKLVIVFLIWLASVALPRHIVCHPNSSEHVKYKSAMVQISLIRSRIVDFQIDVGREPLSIHELATQPVDTINWSGPYITKSLLKDPWGNDWEYKTTGGLSGFELTSFGEDGERGGEGYNRDITAA